MVHLSWRGLLSEESRTVALDAATYTAKPAQSRFATYSVVFDTVAVTHVGATGLAALEDLVRHAARQGIELSVARAKTPLTARLTEHFSGIRCNPTARAAVAAAV